MQALSTYLIYGRFEKVLGESSASRGAWSHTIMRSERSRPRKSRETYKPPTQRVPHDTSKVRATLAISGGLVYSSSLRPSSLFFPVNEAAGECSTEYSDFFYKDCQRVQRNCWVIRRVLISPARTGKSANRLYPAPEATVAGWN